jgi:hypothetical protein
LTDHDLVILCIMSPTVWVPTLLYLCTGIVIQHQPINEVKAAFNYDDKHPKSTVIDGQFEMLPLDRYSSWHQLTNYTNSS